MTWRLVTPVLMTLRQRAYRPLAPLNLRVAGDAYNPIVPGDAVRNPRRLQTHSDGERARKTPASDYEFVLRGGREEVVRVKSQLILPMALALENLPLTESSFPEMIDRVLVQPLNTKFRAFLQRLFDAASRAAMENEAAEKETPLPVFNPPKPGNGTPHEMPEIDCKPPLPQRPSSRDWRSQ